MKTTIWVIIFTITCKVGCSQTIDKEDVLHLTSIINDSTISTADRNYASRSLQYYDFKLYTDQAKENLINSIKIRKLCLDETILEIGALNIPNSEVVLKAIIDSNWAEFSESILIALCRMGDSKSLDTFFSELNKIYPIEDAFTQNYKELEYIKQPACISFLVKLLDSKVVKDMPKETMKPTKLAGEVVRMLGRVVVGFPIKDFYDKDEDDAIKKAKQWWNNNKLTYKIKRNTY